ncbi:hypothetical protein [Paraburkholderia sp. CNPSo 3281]|uniref:hypothetical protein n=1 Tax=Paraburkholderia sp. CNPSo 3281 TaxID=2940933 RepID=UPI0020B6B69C|nr:hypothetical protein [Paraburkholderia sp. CNPSo 3281]MCP3714096.1 hypothetical protein [Paraburkholderia sp. CNPSo 3281]
MSLLVWIGSLGKPLLREVLAGCAAGADAPERAPGVPGVAFLEDAAGLTRAAAALSTCVVMFDAGVAVRPVGFCAAVDSAVDCVAAMSISAAAAGGASALAVSASAWGAARPFCFAAAPAALRDFCALARGSLLMAFPAGARGAT